MGPEHPVRDIRYPDDRTDHARPDVPPDPYSPCAATDDAQGRIGGVVQTFMPYPSFTESAQVLDLARLGDQRIRALEILEVLTGNSVVSSRRLEGGGAMSLSGEHWHLQARRDQNCLQHPVVLMWNGYLQALLDYQRAICCEWIRRGNQDTVWEKSQFLVTASGLSFDPIRIPPWWGSRRLHAAHRAELLATEPSWYGQFGWTDASDPDGLWPDNLSGRCGDCG